MVIQSIHVGFVEIINDVVFGGGWHSLNIIDLFVVEL